MIEIGIRLGGACTDVFIGNQDLGLLIAWFLMLYMTDTHA